LAKINFIYSEYSTSKYFQFCGRFSGFHKKDTIMGVVEYSQKLQRQLACTTIACYLKDVYSCSTEADTAGIPCMPPIFAIASQLCMQAFSKDSVPKMVDNCFAAIMMGRGPVFLGQFYNDALDVRTARARIRANFGIRIPNLIPNGRSQYCQQIHTNVSGMELE
jgi:hypothetical protein